MQTCHQAGHQIGAERGRDAKADGADQGIGGGGADLFQIGDIEQDAACAVEQLATERGQDRLRAALEQRRTDDRFQRADLLRQRWLRDAHLLGGTGEAAGIGQRDEIAQLAKGGSGAGHGVTSDCVERTAGMAGETRRARYG